jgi:GNAT superfamily N-acetyltransferase
MRGHQVSRRQRMAAADSERPTPPVPLPADAQRLVGELHLIDGEIVQTRPIQASDTAKLEAFHASLSPQTIEWRFFGALPVLPEAMAEHFTHVDYADRMALLATTGWGTDERILAVARYDRIGPSEAEVAFVVSDAWQGHGIATALLYRLVGYARAHGITTFMAYVLDGNTRMMEVFRHSGCPCTLHARTGELEVRLDIRDEATMVALGGGKTCMARSSPVPRSP